MHTKRITRIIVVLTGIILVVLAIVAYKMYTKPHRSVENENAIAVSAVQLFQDFEQNETAANAKYVDQVLEVTGKVSEVNANIDKKPVVMLETDNMAFGIQCTMEDGSQVIQPGSIVTIKGICTGYLSDVIITNGILKK